MKPKTPNPSNIMPYVAGSGVAATRVIVKVPSATHIGRPGNRGYPTNIRSLPAPIGSKQALNRVKLGQATLVELGGDCLLS
jgi:hypothetical protein